MKVCIVSHAFPPGKLGGAEIYVERSALALTHQGHEVIVITQAPYSGLPSFFPKTTFRRGIKLYSFYPLNLFSIYRTQNKPLLLKGLWRIIDLFCIQTSLLLLRTIKKEKPELIHLHILHGFSPFFTLFLLRRLNIPTVMTIHTYGLFCMRCDYLKSGLRQCVKKHPCCSALVEISRRITDKFPHFIVAPSKFVWDIHRQNGLFQHTRKTILSNCLEGQPSALAAKNLTKESPFCFIYAGRLVKNKGIHILINAFKLLERRDTKLLICGEGSYEKELKKMSAGCKRIFFTGKLPTEELKEYYRKSSLTIVPSLFCETFGQAVIESFSEGTPVIASRIGALPELIRGGFNGYLFTPGDHKELAGILDSLINDPCRINLLSRGALESAKNYGMAAHVNSLEKIYAEAKISFSGNRIPAFLQQGCDR